MKPKPELRCSALPRIMACNASIAKPGIWIDTESEVARMGTAAHESFALMLQGEDVDLTAIAQAYRIEERELCFLHYSACKIWGKLAPSLEVVAVEQQGETEGPGYKITGKADLIAKTTEGELVVVDLKTGYKDKDVTPQLLGYACIHGASKIISLYSRLGFHEVQDVTPVQLDEFRAKLTKIIQSDNRKYSPDEETCLYCPLAHECEARRQLLASAGADMTAIMQQSQSGELTVVEMGNLYGKAQMLGKALDAYKDQLRALLAETGPIETEAGTLSLKDITRTSINYCPSVLMHFLTDEEINGLKITVQKKGLVDAVCATAPDGQKKHRKDALMLELDNAGALHKSVSKSLDLKKGKK